MSRELFTSSIEYQAAVDRLLALATKRVWIYDEDLAMLHLETPAHIEMLRVPLVATRNDCLRIAVRNLAPLHPAAGLAEELQPQQCRATDA